MVQFANRVFSIANWQLVFVICVPRCALFDAERSIGLDEKRNVNMWPFRLVYFSCVDFHFLLPIVPNDFLNDEFDFLSLAGLIAETNVFRGT